MSLSIKIMVASIYTVSASVLSYSACVPKNRIAKTPLQPTKMDTSAPPPRYDAGAFHTLQSVNLLQLAISCHASPAVAWRVRSRLDSNPIVTRMVTCYYFSMQVIARRTLREFWARYPRAEGPIRAWVAIAVKARWANPAEIKRQFGSAVDFVGDNRVIFDLGGNKYRLVVHVSFSFGRLLVKFIGTHPEYDRIDPETVSWRKK